MGMQIEVNTLLRLGKNDPKESILNEGKTFTISKSNIRLYLIDIPILLLSEDWTVLGYCVVKKVEIKGSGMRIEVKVISRFSNDESKIHTDCLLEALKYSGYLK